MLSTFLRSYLTAPIASQVYSRALWLNEIFERFRPDAVVTFPVYAYLGRIASRMARIDRVPTLMFYHTIPSGMKPHPEFIGSDVTDYVAVCNEQFKATLAASGVSPTKVIVVGNPKFDAIPSRSRFEDRNYVCNKFGANAGADILLVASHILAPGTKEWLCALVRQLKKLDPNRFKLIIKPHPGEDPDVYERILQEEGFSGATISRQVPLYCLLNASDIVFVSHSTVGSEAVLFDRPLICINLTGIPYSVRYDEEGVALLVRKEADILPAIEAVLHDKRVKQRLQRARRQFQQRYAFRLDGRSTDRFANVIRLMATKSLHFNSERRDNVD
jgi:UDP-N-acetylglucosamine 2-epimerase